MLSLNWFLIALLLLERVLMLDSLLVFLIAIIFLICESSSKVNWSLRFELRTIIYWRYFNVLIFCKSNEIDWIMTYRIRLYIKNQLTLNYRRDFDKTLELISDKKNQNIDEKKWKISGKYRKWRQKGAKSLKCGTVWTSFLKWKARICYSHQLCGTIT